MVPVKDDILVFFYRTDVTKFSKVGGEWRKSWLPAHSGFLARFFGIYNFFDKSIFLVKPGNHTASAYDLDNLEEYDRPYRCGT